MKRERRGQLEDRGEHGCCSLHAQPCDETVSDPSPTQKVCVMTLGNDSVKKSLLFNLAELKKRGGLKAGEILAVDPNIRPKFLSHIGHSVRRDETPKNLVLDTGLSGYTRKSINLFLKGKSCIGKTYVTMETLKYFPKEDVWLLGGLSPKALIHGYGVLVDEKGEEIDFADKPTRQMVRAELRDFYKDAPDIKVDKVLVDKEYEDEQKKWRQRLEKSRYIVDLANKILVFLEAPHFDTFNILRPILSHDAYEISYKITDKTSVGSLRTKHVIIRGWPATIFCTTEEKYIQDLATRGLTATPQTDPEKFRDANILTGEKTALPWKFEPDFDFMLLQGYIGWLKNQLQSLEVIIPYGRELGGFYPSTYARSMRDLKHFMALIEVRTLFHCMQRPLLVVGEKQYVIATREDYEHVSEAWHDVEETTLTGLPGHILNFFHKAVEPLSERLDSFGYEDLTREYNEQANERKSSDTVRKWVEHLCDIGWLTKDPDPNDKRKVVVSVIKNPKINGEYRIPEFTDFFSEEALKKWLDDAKKISEHNEPELRENFLSEKSLDFPSFCSDIFQEGSKPETTVKPENKTENSGIQQSPTIPKTLTVQETLILLKSTWQKGSYTDFDKLIMTTRSCAKEDAEQLRETWLNEGLIAYDSEGWLVWTR